MKFIDPLTGTLDFGNEIRTRTGGFARSHLDTRLFSVSSAFGDVRILRSHIYPYSGLPKGVFPKENWSKYGGLGSQTCRFLSDQGNFPTA